MDALQYIYTSWKNGDSTEKGYMIYSRSEGISETECGIIKDAMQYLAPKELTLTPTPQEIADIFPYAFSYFILPTGRGCVAQSTYLGKDYSGRYGNYIIHALVFDIADLPCRPAEFFAEPYIKTAMTDEELNASSPVPPLPPLHISSYASVINDEQLTEFLFDKEEEFSQLISMILASQDAGIPFYLNDTRENLVLWSAAMQRILPSRLARRFMFNTYVGDHESMRSLKAREEGLNFHLIGVRPDANYFNYATECKSSRQIVMDFIGGNMTQGIVPGSFAQAMASSLTLDYEEVDSFGVFVDATSFREINGHLQDAYLYYRVLKNDEFDFTEENLKAVLSFGDAYCSESDNSDVGCKLLVKWQENGWRLRAEVLLLIWNFVCKYSGFMIFTLYDLFTESMYQIANEATAPCDELNSILQIAESETTQQYREYLDYINNVESIDHLLVYLSGHSNSHTNGFYINWLLRSYSYADGLKGRQPVSRLLIVLLENITRSNDCEKQMIDVLLITASNQTLFENVLNIFMGSLLEPVQLERFCARYVEVAETLTDGELNFFEQKMLKTPEAAPIATRLCARKIASAKNPDQEFWRFYENLTSSVGAGSGIAIDLMVLACLNNVSNKNREDEAIDILRRIDADLIRDDETVIALTNTVNECSVKTLAKMDSSFLKQVCQIRARVDKRGVEKIKAVYVGERLESGKARQKRPVSLSEELAQTGLTLKSFDKQDYEAYIKNYFGIYLSMVQTGDDISAIMNIFYHERYFLNFADDYISALKKMQRKENKRWKNISGWTCVYLINADKNDQAAEELYKPVIRYMRSLDEEELLDIRQTVIQEIPVSKCEYLFDEVRRKEGLSEKLGSFFHKK